MVKDKLLMKGNQAYQLEKALTDISRKHDRLEIA